MFFRKGHNLAKAFAFSPTTPRNCKCKAVINVSSGSVKRTKQKQLLLYKMAQLQSSKGPPWTSQMQNVQLYSTITECDVVDANTFERVCEEALNHLAEYFEELVETEPKLEKGDVMYGGGVLTIDLGVYGTYVINRQSPNRQIWLSSPTSGPKRFDYSTKENAWVYKHDGQTLDSLLKTEFENILGKKLEISLC